MKALLFLCLFIGFPFLSTAGKLNFQLSPKLKGSYLMLVDKAGDFHKVIAEGDQKEIQREIRETQEIIAQIYRQISLVPEFHYRIHSHKLLKSIEEQLLAIHSGNVPDQAESRKYVKRLFNSFFELAQVYQLTNDMKDQVFYCPMDKSLWFQEKGKASNPINSNYKTCGRRIL